MERPGRVLLAENIHPVAAELLGAEGYDVDQIRHALGPGELRELLPRYDVLGIRSRTQISAEVVEGAGDLLAIGVFGIGTNQVDLRRATAAGIAVFNAPFSNTRSVVELVLAEIVALSRRLIDKDRALQAGRWDKTAAGSHEVRGRRLGIVGYGNIGSQLSVLAENLGMSVWFYDTADKLALGNARRCASLEELLEAVDVVTLHVDGRPDNRGLFGEEELKRMRPGSLFLNLSRGFVVDHGALRRHVEDGHLAGAAIDVFAEEPTGPDEPFTSELRGLSNVILTPHVGGSTEEAQEDIGRFVAAKLDDFVRNGTTALSVNLPQVAMPGRLAPYRLVHLHRNLPGVLAGLDSVLAQHQVNIEGQSLGTRGDVGYVITDVGRPFTEEILAPLRALEETIRLRVL